MHSKYNLPIALLLKILFFESGRPRTDMSPMTTVSTHNFAQNLSKFTKITAKDELLVHPKWLKQFSINFALIPIVRYGCSSENGCYYKAKNVAAGTNASGPMCGTFYYFEPGSDIYLMCETAKIFENKFAAMKYFVPNIFEPNRSDLRKEYGISKFEMVMPLFEYRKQHFHHFYPLLYALEDPLDQALCKLARKRGINVLVFAYMTGAERIVTEVLDTRDRQSSFDSLVHIISQKSKWF